MGRIHATSQIFEGLWIWFLGRSKIRVGGMSRKALKSAAADATHPIMPACQALLSRLTPESLHLTALHLTHDTLNFTQFTA